MPQASPASAHFEPNPVRFLRNHGKHGKSRKWKSCNQSPSGTALVVQAEILKRHFLLVFPSVTFRVFRGESSGLISQAV